MKQIVISIFTVAVLLIFVPVESRAQEKKKKSVSKKEAQHAEEKFEADAIALAYIRCKTSLSKKEFELDQQNRKLRESMQNNAVLQTKFDYNMFQKYSKDSVRYVKFQEEVADVATKLDICIRYQALLDSIALQEVIIEDKSE